MSARTLLREALGEVRRAPVLSALVLTLVALCTVLIDSTAGQGDALRHRVEQNLSAPALRTTVITADTPVTVSRDALAAYAQRSDVEVVAALGPAADVVPLATAPGGPPVPVRPAIVLSTGKSALQVPSGGTAGIYIPESWLSADGDLQHYAYQDLHGVTWPVSGVYHASAEDVPRLDGTALRLVEGDQIEVRSLLIVGTAGTDPTVHERDAIALLSTEQITVDGSSQAREAAQTVRREISRSGTTALIGALVIGGGVVMILVGVWTLLHQRDIGRRRVLGASRGQIIVIALAHVAALTLTGVTAGTAVMLLMHHLGLLPAPRWSFHLAVAWLVLVVTMLAAAAPTALISRIDPVRVLRQA